MKLDFHRALLLYFLSLIIYNQYYKLGFVVLFDSFSKYGIVNEFTIPITPSVFAYAKPPPSAREATRSVQFFNYVQTCKFVHITLGSLAEGTVIRELQSNSPFKE